MLTALNVDQARFVARLAKAAREQSHDLVGHPAEADLAPITPARGEHPPTAGLGFDPLRPEGSQMTALRDVVTSLSAQGSCELYTLMRIGQGDLAARK